MKSSWPSGRAVPSAAVKETPVRLAPAAATPPTPPPPPRGDDAVPLVLDGEEADARAGLGRPAPGLLGRAEPSVVHDLRDEGADIRVHAPALFQEEAAGGGGRGAL